MLESATYEGLQVLRSDRGPHLGGNIAHGDPYRFAPRVCEYLIKRFAIRSMLDLGSGQGHTAALFHRQGVVALACDGLMRNLEQNVHPTILCDLVQAPFVCRVDLVWCQEVAEHIEEESVGNLVQSLTSGNVIMMTHALPGQGGFHHVNCKDRPYWSDLLSGAGYSLAEEDTSRVRTLAASEGAIYIAQTGLIFLRAQA